MDSALKEIVSAELAASPAPAASARIAIERSIPLLQRSDATFLRKSGCVSCHNNTLTAMSVASARKKGIRVNEDVAGKQRNSIAAFLESRRERLLQNVKELGAADGN